MEIKVKRCLECPMFFNDELTFCQHPDGPQEEITDHLDLDTLPDYCPLLVQDTIIHKHNDDYSLQITFDNWENTSDFLARQITDDLYRAGWSFSHKYQHIIQKTILNWPKTGRTWGKK
jgi:hypothetical protein